MASRTEHMQQQEKKKKKPVALIIIIILIAAALVLGYVYFILPGQQPEPEKTSEELAEEQAAEMGILPDTSAEDIEKRLNEQIDKSMLNISINKNPVFENGEAEGNLRIENIPANHYAMTVELVREDNGETVYKSGLISPGYFVENAKLDTPLAKGIYPAVAVFTAYDTETKQEMGTAGANVNLMIKN
ncbi:hypothetical protein [Christensenella hongkongensis]|uniref:hypothetical protein n=1 Tax=Christensenella hongkongensis TaxID=270498 RepID=UPI002671FE13|nr:hypothetical protein [Christensenella hongkongensis]